MTSSTLTNDPGDAAVIAALAEQKAAREPINLVEGRRVGFVLAADQRLEQIDLEQFDSNPSRKQGTVVTDDPDSFATYVRRHAITDATTLWGSLDNKRVVAVIDDHTEGDNIAAAGWGQHRATLALKTTPEWDRWTENDGIWLDQVPFAEHIEDGANSIVRPDAADMLELAQSFQAKTDVDFKSGSRLTSGETQLRYEETVQASAGVQGTMTIPEFIIVSLEPFVGAPAYELQARFRYRVGRGGLSLSYRLVRPDEAQRLAFADILAGVQTALSLPVMQGTPRSN